MNRSYTQQNWFSTLIRFKGTNDFISRKRGIYKGTGSPWHDTARDTQNVATGYSSSNIESKVLGEQAIDTLECLSN